MARKNSTPTFTHEIKLKTNLHQVRKLMIKFRALRELYNTVLGELFKRSQRMQSDTRYVETCKAYQKDKTNKDTQLAFDELKREYELTQGHLQSFATSIKNQSYMSDHLDAHTTQVISDRAFDAYMKWRMGKRGKPRFKSWKQGIRSIQGKTNSCIFMNKKGKVKWGHLVMDCHYDVIDRYGVQAHALNSEVKYCRIVHRLIKGKNIFYVQLVLKGTPLVKANQQIGYHKSVGLDIGVSTIAAVSKEKALLTPLCQALESHQKSIHKLQRKMARSQRFNNPDNFKDSRFVKKDKHVHKKQGMIKKGKKTWTHSKTYQKDLCSLRDLHRKQRDKRQCLHNQLANEVIALGNCINIEKNHYKAWQKGWFGKTIGFRAPSNFVQTLTRKALKTGGRVEEINAWAAKLSQTCHVCRGFHKKTLKERTHTCNGKPIAQRDLYSALLALYYDEEEINIDSIRQDWESLDTVLKNAMLVVHNSRMAGQHVPDCLIPRQIEKRECIQTSLSVIKQTECQQHQQSEFNNR